MAKTSSSPTSELQSAPRAAGSVSRPAARRRLFVPLSLAIILLSTCLQLGGLNGGAVIDDKRLFTDYQGRGCGADPIDCFHNMMFGFYYRPMISASVAIGQRFHDNSPVWFRIENLVFHALNIAAALWLFRILFRRRNTALVSGLLFALHPIQVCITTFVGGRTDSMVSAFIILFAISVRNAARRMRCERRLRRVAGANRGKITAWIVVGLAALLAAAFTKEQVLPLVLLAPLFAVPIRHASRLKQPRKKSRRFAASKPPYWTAIYGLGVLLFAWAAHSALHDVDFVSADWSPMLHIEMVGRTIWSYFRMIYLPTVSMLHVTTLGAWDSPQYLNALAGLAVGAGWIVLMLRSLNDRPRILLMLWATLGIALCLNLVPVPTQFVSPYRVGKPLAGFAGLLGSFIAPDTPGTGLDLRIKVGTIAALCGIAVWWSAVSVADVPNWSDEYTLMRAEVAADPNFVCARAALASFEQQKGRLDESLTLFDGCIYELFGKSARVDTYAASLKTPQMLRSMQSAGTLRYHPEQYVPQVLRERGRVLLALRRPVDAEQSLREALRANPQDSLAREALAQSLIQLNRQTEAEAVRRMEDVLLGHPL